MTDLPVKTTVQKSGSTLVVRSSVPDLKDYSEYKPFLRNDFFHSCAYCTMAEAEAQAIRFTIDHYEPRNARPELVHTYSNLMYACDECNLRKGDRDPPPSARSVGLRFFRPDNDEYGDHFDLSGVRIEPKSPTAEYTIDALDLNRAALRKLRELRRRLSDCEEAVMQGILALRGTHLDRLPPKIRGQVAKSITHAQAVADNIAAEIDKVLRSFAKSELIDDDPESLERAKERGKRLDAIKAMHPGSWRAQRKSRTR
ncbi:MAG TPA: HNH endonuclease [Bradyrhizobium sp.]|nr:HNH endonuclease [Bradyrhizobium sp.]